MDNRINNGRQEPDKERRTEEQERAQQAPPREPENEFFTDKNFIGEDLELPWDNAGQDSIEWDSPQE